MKPLLGGKGANLAEMTLLKLPVPPGFVITTEVCRAYLDNMEFPAGFMDEFNAKLAELEEKIGKKFGDPGNPLLVSVRSGAAASMPGMMDTILNLGLNDHTVQGLFFKTTEATGRGRSRVALPPTERNSKERFCYDAYRRFINMFGNVVLDIPHGAFEAELDLIKHHRSATVDTELTTEDLKTAVARFKEIVLKETGRPFPEDPRERHRLDFRRQWIGVAPGVHHHEPLQSKIRQRRPHRRRHARRVRPLELEPETPASPHD